MWRFALSRRWWAGHVLVVACSGLFLGLARWQWDRAHSASGDWQNFGYALQWPFFAVFLVAAWVRFLWLEQQRDHAAEPSWADPGPTSPTPKPPAPPSAARMTVAPMTAARTTSVRTSSVRTSSARPSSARPTPEDDPDDELAAYNAYLAQLAEQDRRR